MNNEINGINVGEHIPPREHTKKFNWPDNPSLTPEGLTVWEYQQKFTRELLVDYKLVLVCGLTSTGKSTFLDAYPGQPGWTTTRWDRDRIWNMLFTDGRRVDRYYGYFKRFEDDVIPEVLNRSSHQVVVEGWMSKIATRGRWLEYLPSSMGRACAVVFDGPPDAIVDRNVERGKLGQDPADVEKLVRDKLIAYDWPAFDEGFADIYYVNTFGLPGEQYFKQYVQRP